MTSRTSPQGVNSTANAYVPLSLSAAGLLLCCLPLGAIGALQAGSALKEAKARGQEPNPLFGVARGVGWLSILVSLGAYGYGVKAYRDNESAVASLGESVANKRSETTLDPAVACTLAKAELMKKGAVENVLCETPLETKGDRAVLANVVATSSGKKSVSTVCFAKAKRWFVLETLDTGSCSSRSMDPKLKGLPTGDSQEALERAEDLYRKDEKVFKRYVRGIELRKRLAQIRENLREEVPRSCPDLSSFVGGERLEIPYVEFAWMKKDSKLEEKSLFDFMTKKELRDILLDEGSELDRTKALEKIEGAPIFAVFAPKEKPVAPSPRPGGFLGGEYTGSLFLVDAKTLKPLCEKPFHFENGETISVRRSRLGVTSQSKLEDKLAADFEEHFEDAATVGIEAMSGGKLKLGMSWLE